MDRLLQRGHGPAVYGYGWSWFKQCLQVADAADADAAQNRRLERAKAMADIRVAVNGDKTQFEQYFEALTRE